MHFCLALFHEKNTDEEIARLMDPYAKSYYDQEDDGVTRYNPNSKWDWYVIGGRWDGWMIFKKDKRLVHGNQCKVSQLSELVPTYAVLTPDGKWYERGLDNPYWIDQCDPWDSDFKSRFLDTADSDWYVTIIDYHS